MFCKNLYCFERERGLYALKLVRELVVNLQSALNLSTAVDDGAMVAATNHLTYAYGRNLGIFLCEVHRHLTRHDKLALAAAAVDIVDGDVEMVAHSTDDLFHGDVLLLLHLNRAFEHLLSHRHVYATLVDHREGLKHVEHALKVAHRAVGVAGYKLGHIARYVEILLIDVLAEDVHAQLSVGTLQRRNESTLETCEQTVHHALQLYRRTVSSEDYSLVVAEKMIEDMEEGVLSAFLVLPLLYVVNYQNVDGLIEIDEIVNLVLNLRRGILHLEGAGVFPLPEGP